MLLPTCCNAALVLYDLTARSIWVDEASTFAGASQHGAALWHFIRDAAGNMFLYYAAMHVVVSSAGAGLWALRLPSALAEIACVPLGYLMLERLLGRRAAIGGSWMLAAGATAIYWGQQARGYAPAMCCSTAAGFALVLAVGAPPGRRRNIAWITFVLCSILSIYTILLSALVTAAQLASLLALRRREAQTAHAALACGAIAACCLPLVLAALARGTIGVEWLGAPGTPFGPAYGELVGFLASSQVEGIPATVLAVPLGIATTGLWALGAAITGRRLHDHQRDIQTWAYALLLSWLLLPPLVASIVSVLVHPVLQDRYLLTSVPAASMLAGAVVTRLPGRALAGGLLACSVLARGYVLRPGYGVPVENWQAVASYVSASTRAGDCAAFYLADGYSAFDYYATVEAYRPLPRPVLPASPYRTRQPYALDPAILEPGALAATVASCPRLWLIRTHETGGRPAAGSPPFQLLKYRRYRELIEDVRAHYELIAARPFTGILVELYGRGQQGVSSSPRSTSADGSTSANGGRAEPYRGPRATARSTGVSSVISVVTKKSSAVMPLAPATPRRATRW